MDKILRNIQVEECLPVSYYSLQVPLAAVSDFLTSESRAAAVTYPIVEQVFVGRPKGKRGGEFMGTRLKPWSHHMPEPKSAQELCGLSCHSNFIWGIGLCQATSLKFT